MTGFVLKLVWLKFVVIKLVDHVSEKSGVFAWFSEARFRLLFLLLPCFGTAKCPAGDMMFGISLQFLFVIIESHWLLYWFYRLFFLYFF